ncbi:MAG: methyl-accepting chemotaxis protein [Thermoleophilaceae bacterium]|nr:methyl-accepting chemotaxis protein [Thermoleophilaceae bacterium]
MTEHNSNAPELSTAQRVLPQWFLDLDAARKPYVIVGIVLIGLVPLLALAVLAAKDLQEQSDLLNSLLAQPDASLAEIQAASAAIHDDYQRYAIGAIGGIIWATVVAVGGARVAAQVAVDWVDSLTSAARRIADGDLGVVIERDNESQIGDIQESMGKMVASFRATVTRIERAASELTDSATAMAETSDSSGRAIGEVAQSISSISEGASHQVALITEASGVVAQIETAVVETARNAAAAQEESAQTEHLTEAGVDRATEIQSAMETVRAATHSTVEMVRSLSETSANIDEIVRSITSISGQTNLLALNAAIEAARAGEQGRGFAVVAEEVRKLAEDSQSSAEGIAELIDSIQAQTVQAVAAMEEGMTTVDRGFEAVNRNRQLFFDISGAVRMFHESSVEIAGLARSIADDAGRVRERIEEVASVAEESSASTEEVSASTEETSASSQQLTAAAQRVSQTAVSLKELAGRFSVGDERGGA